jgi:hypothetical protein
MDTPIATNSLVLGRILSRQARYRPNHLAVVVRERAVDLAEFNARVNRWANALTGLGVARGDRVATLLPNCLEALATTWACAKLGAAACRCRAACWRTGCCRCCPTHARGVARLGGRSRRCWRRCGRGSATPARTIVLVDGEAPDSRLCRLAAAAGARARRGGAGRRPRPR